MARAEDIYSMIVERGEEALDELIEQSASEELFLDFKRSADNGAGNSLHNRDRANLEKVISGFGNSEGGVVVWGIECSFDQETGDVASEKIPIENPARFKSLLEGAISGRTIPPHGTVQNHAIPSGEGDHGFVITLIPQSDHAPHQTTNDRKYFMRAGSDFLPVPHAILAGLFGRRPQPNIYQAYTLHPPLPSNQEGVQLDIGLILRNNGRGIASDIFAHVLQHTLPGPNCTFEFVNIDTQSFIGNFMFSRKLIVHSKPEIRLPPDAELVPFTMRIEFNPPFDDDFKFTGNCGSGGSETRQFEKFISRSSIDTAVQSVMEALPGGATQDEMRAFTDAIF